MESAQLWMQYMAGRDGTMRDRLVERYLPHAKSLAAMLYRARGDNSVSFDDYLQYARLGLLEAVDRFDPRREASFETFSSYRIRGAVLNGLGDESELAAQRAYWRNRVQERMDSLRSNAFTGDVDFDFDELVQTTVGLALGELLERNAHEPADESVEANPYAATELAQLRQVIQGFVEKLPLRERDLIRRHYYEHREFQAIAEEFALTKGRVSQLHAQALARIRKLLTAPLDLDRTV
jgi:RNA polymerase sigma factor for flagellar operon FliA